MKKYIWNKSVLYDLHRSLLQSNWNKSNQKILTFKFALSQKLLAVQISILFLGRNKRHKNIFNIVWIWVDWQLYCLCWKVLSSPLKSLKVLTYLFETVPCQNFFDVLFWHISRRIRDILKGRRIMSAQLSL